MSGFKQLFQEIHRRSLWQVLGFYLLGAWIVLQVVDVLAQNIDLPGWVFPFALVLLLIGLPIVMATAFVQKGMGRREMVARAHTLFTWRNAITGGLVASSLWGIVATGWLLLGPRFPGDSSAAEVVDIRSVAVLPFANRSNEEGSEYFTDGMHDDILTQLAKIGGLKVISRTSVMEYQDANRNVRQIAEELGVATVLEGGVERAGDRVRITVQLVDARTDQHLWAETYDEQLTAANIFAIRSDIARKIATALKATLTPEVEERLVARPPESLEAYDLYTRGRYLSHSRERTRTTMEEAAELFRQAIAIDPDYALAYAGLADAYLSLWNRGHLPPEEAMPVVRAAVDRALASDAGLAEAHAIRGSLLEAELRFEESEQAFKRALELNPGSADAHREYGYLLSDLGRYEEVVSEMRRAVELDPLSIRNRTALATMLWFSRDYDGSIAESQKILEIDSESSRSLYNLGFAYTLRGDHEEGIAALRRALELSPCTQYYITGLAWAYARAGHGDEALQLMGQVEERGPFLKEFAIVYGELGDLDRAFEYLERAYQEDPGSLTYMNVDPSADALKADPRFDELLRKLGLQ
jgi:TolB-like protein/Tfp pilus assembly protein PilF